MGNYNNRIITISGDPVSGKGRVTQKLREFYESEGYEVQVISIGDFFRKAAQKEYKKMFPEIKNPTIEEINSNPNFAETLHTIDEKIDMEIIPEEGEKINSRPRLNKIFIIDARLAWFSLKQENFAVRLTVDSKTAGERVFNDTKRGLEDRYPSLEVATWDTAKRRKEEIKRYKERYGQDITNPNNFDLVIGTTLANIDEIASTIIKCENLSRQEKPFAKTWASPELFFPTQTIHDTFSNGPFTAGLTPDELAELIQKNGIFPDAPVYSKTVTNSPYQFVIDGHHRVFASIMAGKTLIPYEKRGTIDSLIVPSSKNLSSIYDHEDAIRRPNGEKFRYKTYPKIDERCEGLDICD